MIFSYLLNMQSHPSWVCGLKQDKLMFIFSAKNVTPFVGVWIETEYVSFCFFLGRVTPFVGVWIETERYYGNEFQTWRHTLRGCVD